MIEIIIRGENYEDRDTSGKTFITVPNLGMDFPQRRLVVVLEKRDKNNKIVNKIILNDKSNDVATKISLSRNYGGIDPKAVIMACNLADETINSLMTLNYAEDNPTTVKVYFGYEKLDEKQSGIPLLFEGNVLWAIPTQTRPDCWFRIECLETFHKSNKFITTKNKDLTNLNPFQIITELLYPFYHLNFTKMEELWRLGMENTGARTRYNYYTSRQANYNFSGTIGEFLNKEIYNFGRMSAYIEGSALHILPASDDMDFLSSNATPDLTISATSNPPMIGNPKPNPTGIDFTTLFPQDYGTLLNYFRVGSYFNLDSEFFPVFNRTYWVQKINYELTNRENASFCRVTARRAS